MTYKLGILDQSPIFPGQTDREALQSTIRLAQKAEAWGYERFWVAEHHQSPDRAGSSPEILMSHLLAKTNSIKIGAGGVMLQHYSPYKVAENFHVMASLAPDRVELGVGKAPGGFSISTEALRYGGAASEIDFDERFRTLQHLVDNTLPEDHALHGAIAHPRPDELVPTFLLGGSPGSAKLAAEAGANFVFARFLNGNDATLQEAIDVYREIYPEGKFIVAVAAYAAASQEEAEEEASNYIIYKIHLESGRKLNVQTWEQVEKFREQTDEAFEITEQKVEMIAGSAAFVKEELDHLASRFQVDEFILHTSIKDETKRLKSFELLGQYNFEMTGR